MTAVEEGSRVTVAGHEGTWYVRRLWGAGWARVVTLAGDELKVWIEECTVVEDAAP